MSEFGTGGCLCGAVRYSIVGPMRSVIYCHCSQCRKQSGHYYAATSSSNDDLKVVGSQHLTWYRASESARRGFCSKCGSALFWKGDGSADISILAGSLDLPTGLQADRHIYVADKGDYYTIDDGLPQFAQSD